MGSSDAGRLLACAAPRQSDRQQNAGRADEGCPCFRRFLISIRVALSQVRHGANLDACPENTPRTATRRR
jgi:hypothetical protein